MSAPNTIVENFNEISAIFVEVQDEIFKNASVDVLFAVLSYVLSTLVVDYLVSLKGGTSLQLSGGKVTHPNNRAGAKTNSSPVLRNLNYLA